MLRIWGVKFLNLRGPVSSLKGVLLRHLQLLRVTFQSHSALIQQRQWLQDRNFLGPVTFQNTQVPFLNSHRKMIQILYIKLSFKFLNVGPCIFVSCFIVENCDEEAIVPIVLCALLVDCPGQPSTTGTGSLCLCVCVQVASLQVETINILENTHLGFSRFFGPKQSIFCSSLPSGSH